MGSTLTPPVALGWTLASAFALLALPGLETRGLYAAGLLMLAAMAAPTAHTISTVLKWTATFAVPLVLIHGVINPAYPQTATLLGAIPVREGGLSYGLSVALAMCVITTVATVWSQVDRDVLVDDLSRLALPTWLIVVAAQSIAVIHLVRLRVDSVYLAQRARGIAVGPGFVTRLRALPSVLIPVVVATLSDADARATALASRGFGATRILPVKQRRVGASEAAWSASALALALAIFSFAHL